MARKDQEMLSALLKQGRLTAKEREVFEGMWDQTFRTKKLSHKQMAWIEKVYFQQELNRSIPRAAKKRGPKVGFLRSETARRTTAATSMKQFEAMCPHIEPGTPIYQRVQQFFRDGGERFELRPKKPEPEDP